MGGEVPFKETNHRFLSKLSFRNFLYLYLQRTVWLFVVCFPPCIEKCKCLKEGQ